MCGIVGFNWEDQAAIRRLAALLGHRGPEQDGYHVADGVSIGHKRLRIIDLSDKGRQPIYNEDKTICTTFNGEIFNFAELKIALENAGHHFESHTDTEVLVHGYEQWGSGLLDRLNGQFAFCVFDKKKNIFFIARDRLGIKPLYYYSGNGKFIFGSELKVLLKSDIPKHIDRFSLDHYMLFGNAPSQQSILEDVKKLAPAHYLIYDLAARKIQLTRYWDAPHDCQLDCDENELKKLVAGKVEEAVKRQLVSDVPLGAFLSGGVDSSIIVAIMRKYVKELNTFSIRFDRPNYNESHYARIVSDQFQTAHHEIEFNAASVRDLIAELPYFYDEPFGDPSMIPTCLVCRVARQHVTVSLSGTGGDELFGGYPRYQQFGILKKLNHLPSALKYLLRGAVQTGNVLLKKDILNKLVTFLGPRQNDLTIYLQLFSYMFRTQNESLDQLANYEDLNRYFQSNDDAANAMNLDIHHYLPEDLLVKEDRASMAVSLEARVPLLDHELVEFAATIPTRYKIKMGQQKYILKKAFADILPHEILYRPKRGFAVPLAEYFRNELKDYAYREIFDFDAYEYFSKDQLRGLWHLHQTGRSDYSRLFWSIMMFNLWYKKWMI